MKLVVGLGNPGRQYEGTRHNIGFAVLGELGRRFGASGVTRGHEAELAEIFIGSEKVLLLAPQTYMNLSGRSVQSAIRFFKLDVTEILVVCDDLNLPLGQLRMRSSGSSGGQKGLRDIITHLGTEEVPRLRFGIGRPPGKMDVSSYVLKPFLGEERDVVAESLVLAVDSVESWVRNGVVAAMNSTNNKAVE